MDASGNDKGRLTAIQATREWGKVVFFGEGGPVDFQPSRDLRDQTPIYAWGAVEERVERLVRWGLTL